MLCVPGRHYTINGDIPEILPSAIAAHLTLSPSLRPRDPLFNANEYFRRWAEEDKSSTTPVSSTRGRLTEFLADKATSAMDDTLEGGSSVLAAAIAEPGGKRDSGESREQTQLCVKTARRLMLADVNI